MKLLTLLFSVNSPYLETSVWILMLHVLNSVNSFKQLEETHFSSS